MSNEPTVKYRYEDVWALMDAYRSAANAGAVSVPKEHWVRLDKLWATATANIQE